MPSPFEIQRSTADRNPRGGPSGDELETELIVAERREVADDVVELTFKHPEDRPLAEWTPGAHLDLILDDGLTRQYSLCSSPQETRSCAVAVLLDPKTRGGSRHVHEQLAAGTRIRVRGPRNNFPLEPAERYQFIAGGIGITPLIPMLAVVDAAGADWHLLYGGRRRASMAFVDELTALYGDRVEISPEDESGLLDLPRYLSEPHGGTLVYACGPEPLLNAVESTVATAGWPVGTLHTERFSAKAIDDQDGALAEFDVVCDRSGMTVHVGPDQTILAALEDAGIDVLSSCTEGVCGTCEQVVLEGTPAHRDSVLSDAQHADDSAMCVCISRSQSARLVLDI